MTDVGSSDGWVLGVAGPDAELIERFKWGWNPERGETVWSVGGPGDGLPSHSEHLEAAWGRAPDMTQRDVLGMAFRYARGADDEDSEREVIEIDVFYGRHVPGSVIDWFRSAFPQALLRPSRTSPL